MSVWGGAQLISTLNIIPELTSQFTNGARVFNAFIKALQHGQAPLVAVTKVFARVGGEAGVLAGALASSLPIITAIVAAITGIVTVSKAVKNAFDYDLQLSKLKDLQEEYKTVGERIEELEALGDSRTTQEERELKVLKAQTAELDKQIKKQEEKAKKAAVSSFTEQLYGEREAMEGTPLAGHFGGTFLGGGTTQTYNKVRDQFENLVEMAQKGRQSDEDYAKSLRELVSEYGNWADAVEGIGLDEFNDEVKMSYAAVRMAQAELKELGVAVEEVEPVSEAFRDVTSRTNEASQALDNYKNKLAGLTDYGAPLQGYRDAFADILKQIQENTANYYELQIAAELFLPQEKLDEFSGDMELVAEYLAGDFNKGFGRVLTSDNPLLTFNQVLLDMAGDTGNIINTTTGEVVATAKIIDGSIVTQIRDYEQLADVLGTTEDAISSIAGAAQENSKQLVIMEADAKSAFKQMKTSADQTKIVYASISDAVAAIAQAIGSQDPAVITEYYNLLQELDLIEIEDKDAKVEIDAQEAQEALVQVQETEEKIEDKDITITAYSRNIDSIAGAWNGIRSKVIELRVNVRDGKTGSLVSLSQASGIIGGRATGDKHFAGGYALVNDGSPVNGSSAELIIDNGRAFIANGGQEGVVNLGRNAQIYTAAETQQILKNSNGGVLEALMAGGINSYANGTPSTRSGIVTPLPTPSANYDPTASGTITITTKDSEKMKEEFDKWLKEKKHYLAMDMITEAEYYRDLEKMNEKYLANKEEFLEEYWQHQEEIYNYEKQALKDEITLEEKLNELQKAKTQQVLVYKDGMFQYVSNTEAIARAQREVAAYGGGTQLLDNSGIVGNLGSMKSDAFASSGSTNITNINVGEVTLEKADNVDELFEGLSNLALQKSMSRG